MVKVLGLGAGKRFGCLFKLATTFKSYLPAYKCYVTIYGSLTKGRCVILLKAIKASHMQLYCNIWRGKGALTWILICRMSTYRAYFMTQSFDLNIKSRCIFSSNFQFRDKNPHIQIWWPFMLAICVTKQSNDLRFDLSWSTWTTQGMQAGFFKAFRY